jgi:hypothetical protein
MLLLLSLAPNRVRPSPTLSTLLRAATPRSPRGPGVVGEQPVLKPGSSFQYESACPLRTPTGKMEGAYQMVGCLRVRGGRCA